MATTEIEVRGCGGCPFANTDGTGGDVCWLDGREIECDDKQSAPDGCRLRVVGDISVRLSQKRPGAR